MGQAWSRIGHFTSFYNFFCSGLKFKSEISRQGVASALNEALAIYIHSPAHKKKAHTHTHTHTRTSGMRWRIASQNKADAPRAMRRA